MLTPTTQETKINNALIAASAYNHNWELNNVVPFFGLVVAMSVRMLYVVCCILSPSHFIFFIMKLQVMDLQ